MKGGGAGIANYLEVQTERADLKLELNTLQPLRTYDK